jgi:hypothetical protein
VMAYVQASEASKRTGDNHGSHDRDRPRRVDSKCSRCMEMPGLQSPKTTVTTRGGDVLST